MTKKPLTLPRAVVFDLDGTLVHSAPDLHAALNRLMADEGRRALDLQEVVLMIGDGVPKLVERGFKATGDLPDDSYLAGAVKRFLADYEIHATVLTKLFPAVAETLTALKAAGCRLGVCTNKPEAATLEILTELGIKEKIDVIVGGDTLESIRKPDPRHLQAVLERLGTAPDDAVMVGDNPNDVASARNAGVRVIAVTFGYSRVAPPDLGADRLIDGYGELLDALAGLASQPAA